MNQYSICIEPLYQVSKTEIDKAQSVLTESFAHDPFMQYLMGRNNYNLAKASLFHKFIINYGLKYGLVLATSANFEGVAIWLPPDIKEFTAWKSINAGIVSLARIEGMNLKKRLRFFRRFKGYGAYAAQLHEKYASFTNWHLLEIGIADNYRGKGFASKLLRPILDELDKKGLHCYLETHNPVNVEIYRHFGFDVVIEGKLPDTEKPHWSMLRKPILKNREPISQ
jgi:ribosomal protein S18 acetylase RimI-like enzyme